jgi:hypothetical protein
MAELGDSWNDIVKAAQAAQEAASGYEQAKQDPERSESERSQAREEYKQARARAYQTLREARVREHDGLWSEVLEAVQHAQAAARTYVSAKHDPERSEPQWAAATEAYGKAKDRLLGLLAELKIVKPAEATAAEEEKAAAEAPAPAEEEKPEEAPEPAAQAEAAGEEAVPGPCSPEVGSSF